VRELERSGLDASVARALLQIYEESKAKAIVNRDSRRQAMIEFDAAIGEHETFDDAEFDHRLAA